MTFMDLGLIIIMLTLNTIFLYKGIIRKNILKRSKYDIISLGNDNENLIDKLINPLLFFNYLIILSYIIIKDFSFMFLLLYISILFLNLPIIYVSSDYIGTLIKGKNTKNIDFIQINLHNGDIELILNYKNTNQQKLKYVTGILNKNKEKKIEELVRILRSYGYKVYVNGWNLILS